MESGDGDHSAIDYYRQKKFSAPRVELPLLAVAFDKWRKEVVSTGIDLTGKVKDWPILAPLPATQKQQSNHSFHWDAEIMAGEVVHDEHQDVDPDVVGYMEGSAYAELALYRGQSMIEAMNDHYISENSEDSSSADGSERCYTFEGEEYSFEEMQTRPIRRKGGSCFINCCPSESDDKPALFEGSFPQTAQGNFEKLSTIVEQDCSSSSSSSSKSIEDEQKEDSPSPVSTLFDRRYASLSRVKDEEDKGATAAKVQRSKSLKRRFSEVGNSMKKMFMKGKKTP